jgi:ABC-type transport system involved in multi-copper enzyme maturation permease subunit
MMSACWVAILEPFFTTGGGGRVFGYLHFTLFCAIWILVPLLTADCLSRERREGTLPLLFLTPLKPRGIVLAKTLAHGLRALSLWLAVLPTMCIPFLLGGVGWKEALLSVAVNFSSMVLALAAGLLASSFCRTWRSSIVAALLLAFLFAVMFVVLNGLGAIGAIYRYIPGAGRSMIWRSLDTFLYTVSIVTMNFDGTWEALNRLPAAAGRAWMAANFGMIVVSLLGAWIITWVAAWQVNRVWRDEPESARAERLGKVLRRPVFEGRLLRRWLRWRLAQNPVGWLEQRRASGRLAAWGWIAAVGLFYGLGGLREAGYDSDFQRIQALLACFLVGSMAMAAAGSFRRERESGLLELLLVSPLREWDIIGGRLRALWGQFLPAVVVFFTAALFQTFAFRTEEPTEWLPYFALVYVTIPVMGLYFSLARRQFMGAFLWTLLFGGFLPFIVSSKRLPEVVVDLLGMENDQIHKALFFWAAFAIQSGLAFAFALILRNHLARRKFALEVS